MKSKAAVDGKSAECLLVFLTMVVVRGVMLTMMMSEDDVDDDDDLDDEDADQKGNFM